MAVPAEVLETLGRYCDLAERLPLVPAAARVRGVYFRNIEASLAPAGKLERYRALCPERYSAMRWYPVSELLVHVAVAGSLLTSAERVHEGMFEVARINARGLSESLVGRTLLRLLSHDPVKLLRQGQAARRQTTDYGTWSISFPEPRTAIMEMRQEYLYLESYCLGSAQGTFEAIGLPVRARAELDDRFNGRHILTW